VRLFIAFRNGAGERRALEIIWENRLLGRGDVKFRGSFPHYVANGGAKNIGRWHDERVDLLTSFRRFWPNNSPGRVADIAVFYGSDETGPAASATTPHPPWPRLTGSLGQARWKMSFAHVRVQPRVSKNAQPEEAPP
jgi:hypothetical protein